MNGSDASSVLQPVGALVIVPLRGPVNGELLADLNDKILAYLQEHGSRGIVLDMAGVEVLDLDDMEGIRALSESASLMGAPVVLASIQPGVAAGLTMLDADDRWVRATRTVEQAMTLLS